LVHDASPIGFVTEIQMSTGADVSRLHPHLDQPPCQPGLRVVARPSKGTAIKVMRAVGRPVMIDVMKTITIEYARIVGMAGLLRANRYFELGDKE
jgi:hypothetical protein